MGIMNLKRQHSPNDGTKSVSRCELFWDATASQIRHRMLANDLQTEKGDDLSFTNDACFHSAICFTEVVTERQTSAD